VWQDDVHKLRQSLHATGLSLSWISSLASSFSSYAYWNLGLGLIERGLDVRARLIKMNLWMHGLITGGLRKAEAEMAGLAV
jgi:aarF domain-containing kinase